MRAIGLAAFAGAFCFGDMDFWDFCDLEAAGLAVLVAFERGLAASGAGLIDRDLVVRPVTYTCGAGL